LVGDVCRARGGKAICAWRKMAVTVGVASVRIGQTFSPQRLHAWLSRSSSRSRVLHSILPPNKLVGALLQEESNERAKYVTADRAVGLSSRALDQQRHKGSLVLQHNPLGDPLGALARTQNIVEPTRLEPGNSFRRDHAAIGNDAYLTNGEDADGQSP
jgi:hypothetical protein